jgi:hypothetical protein
MRVDVGLWCSTMSYDLILLPKPAGQSWEAALEALEVAQPGGRPDAQAWARIVAGASRILGDVVTHEADYGYDLDHEPTGIELSYSAVEAGIGVPYSYTGAEAAAVVQKIYQLGRVVEAATGFTGYDPQLELPLADAMPQAGRAVAAFEQVATSLAERGTGAPVR